MKRYTRLPKVLQLYIDSLYESYLFNKEATSVEKSFSTYDSRMELLKKRAAIRQVGKNLLKKLGKLKDEPKQDTNYIEQLENLAMWYGGAAGGSFIKGAQTALDSGSGRKGLPPEGVGGDVGLPFGGDAGDGRVPPGGSIGDVGLPPGGDAGDGRVPPGDSTGDVGLPSGGSIGDVGLPFGGDAGDGRVPLGDSTGDVGLPPGGSKEPSPQEIKAQINQVLIENLDEKKYSEYAADYEALRRFVDRRDLEGVRSIDPGLALGLELLDDPSKVDQMKPPFVVNAISRLLLYIAYTKFSKFVDEPEKNFHYFKQTLESIIKSSFEDNGIDPAVLDDAFGRFLEEQARRGITYKKPQDAVSAFLSWVHDPNVSPWYKFALAIGAPLSLGGLLAAVISKKPTAGLVMSLLGLAGTGYGVYGFIQNRIKENEGPRVEVKTPPPGWKPPPEKRLPALLVDPKEVKKRLEANGERRQALSSFIDDDAFVRMVGDMRDLDIIAYLEKLDDYTLVDDLFGTLRNTRYPAEDRFIILDNFMKRGLKAGLYKILTDDQEYDKFIAMYGYETKNPGVWNSVQGTVKDRKRLGARNALQAYEKLTQHPSTFTPEIREQMINIFANNIWSVFAHININSFGKPDVTVGKFVNWLK